MHHSKHLQIVKGSMSRGFWCIQVNSALEPLLSRSHNRLWVLVQVNSVPESLLSIFTYIIYKVYKGTCHGDFAVFRSVLC